MQVSGPARLAGREGGRGIEAAQIAAPPDGMSGLLRFRPGRFVRVLARSAARRAR